MANPNSLLTKMRFRLAQRLDPYPDKGEAWCIDCELNDFKTLILNAAGHSDHIHKHRDLISDGPTKNAIAMRVNWGNIPPSDEEPL